MLPDKFHNQFSDCVCGHFFMMIHDNNFFIEMITKKGFRKSTASWYLEVMPMKEVYALF